VNLLEVTKISKEKKSILYVQTSDVPARQYSPLVLTQTAKSMEIEAKVYIILVNHFLCNWKASKLFSFEQQLSNRIDNKNN